MKLGEKSARRGGRMRSVDTLTKPLEDEIGFDAKNQLTDQDWTVLANDVKVRLETQQGLVRCIKMLMAAQSLDPVRYHSLVNAPELKATYDNMASPDHPYLLQGMQPDQPVVTTLLYRLAIQDVFPQHEEGKVKESEKEFLRENTNYEDATGLEGSLVATETLYVMKRLHIPGIITGKVQIPEKVFERFKTVWQETWGVGHLEDILPDKLVKQLAMIRIIDPNLFKQIPLDKNFWSLAKGWLHELRDSNGQDVNDIFRFAFDLSILAAEEVRVMPDGKLDIRPKKTGLDRQIPLPERQAV